jgi:hypothetical protein
MAACNEGTFLSSDNKFSKEKFKRDLFHMTTHIISYLITKGNENPKFIAGPE